MRGGLAIDRCIQRQDDFAHLRIMRARHQRVDREVLRTDAVERRQRPAQHVVAAAGRIGPLQRPQIGDVGDHDDDRVIAPRVGAHGAGVLGVDIAAGLADLDLVDRHLQRAGERRHQRLALLDQMQRRAPRRARPKPRQPRQQLDQALDFGTGNRMAISAETKSRRQAQSAGQRLHLFLHRDFRLAPRVIMRGHQQILEDLALLGLHQ